MPRQRHIIKRQIVQVGVPHQHSAHQLQQRLSSIYRNRLVPIVDKYCSQLSDPDSIHRIDSLELDLGTLDLENLEEDLVARFTRQLPELLSARIRQAESMASGGDGADMQTVSQLELLAHFTHTGSLPWWADSSRPGLLDESLRHLVRHAPRKLNQLMRELTREQQSLQRIIHHFDDLLLAELLKVLPRSAERVVTQLPSSLLSLLPTMKVAAGRSRTDIRTAVWQAVLFTAALRSEQCRTPVAFCREVLLQIAGRWRVDYAGLVSALSQTIDEQEPRLDSPLGTTVQTLQRETAGHQPAETKEVLQQLVAMMDRLQHTGGPLAPLFTTLRPAVDRLSVHDRAEWLAAHRQLDSRTTDGESVDTKTLQSIIGLLRTALQQRLLPPAAVRQCLADLKKPGAADLPPKPLSELFQMLKQTLEDDETLRMKTEDEAPLDLRFSDADEVYVVNAGLVVLWPFFGHFFKHLRLLEYKRFKDAAAQQRAVGLLGYLATKDPLSAEYLLPLCKLLCGMDLTEVFEFGEPVSEAEAAECDNLLTAVIAQARILRNMSIAGFRGSFLIRQGVLSARDGAWLLRVERETDDVVLDRFPWTMHWVKLPWMHTSLRVEW